VVGEIGKALCFKPREFIAVARLRPLRLRVMETYDNESPHRTRLPCFLTIRASPVCNNRKSRVSECNLRFVTKRSP
jgi:hypothetical protein